MKPNTFNSIKLEKPKRNLFDLTHDFKFTGNMGNLIPVMCMEAIPGDSFKIGHESLIRFAPMVAPVMHRMDVTIHTFFVPYRILWEGWEDFISNTDPGGGVPAFPTIIQSIPTGGSLQDYFGIPYDATGGTNETISAMPFAAYQCIYNEYYRDQNLIPEVDWQLTDGDNSANASVLTQIRKRAWQHDYFTSALPWAQKGANVEIPIGTVELADDITAGGKFRAADGSSLDNTAQAIAVDGSLGLDTAYSIQTAGLKQVVYDPNGTLQTSAVTINSLRNALQLQKWLEKNARGGTRYTEFLYVHFGVRSQDSRLQRPEYITGVKSPVVISEVLNTTGTDDLPQGNMSGHGISVNSAQHSGSYYCQEHGLIISLMSVLPLPVYQQGIPKIFTKHTDYSQYYFTEFAHLGEQPIENRELLAFEANGDNTFGYTPRYAEYRYQPSRVAGQFRTSLDFWHLARKFTTMPALNQDFIECDPTTRIFAVTDPNEHHLFCHVLNNIKAVRPVPYFGTPMS